LVGTPFLEKTSFSKTNNVQKGPRIECEIGWMGRRDYVTSIRLRILWRERKAHDQRRKPLFIGASNVKRYSGEPLEVYKQHDIPTQWLKEWHAPQFDSTDSR
jgi:hypothetical protein